MRAGSPRQRGDPRTGASRLHPDRKVCGPEERRHLPETTRRILRDCAEANLRRRERLTTLVAEMLPAADYYVAGQALTLKAATSLGALDEAMEYLVQNTFNKTGMLKHLCSEPLKETQAVLRANDVDR